MGFGLEVDMIRAAHEMDLLTTPYAFDPDQAGAMAQAGADILIPHMGLTTKGSIGTTTALTLQQAAQRVQEMHDAAKRPIERFWSSATGDRSPSQRTPSTSSITRKESWASTAPAAWSDCLSNRLLPTARAVHGAALGTANRRAAIH